MNRCPNSGYLVDATRTVPTDPTDCHVDDLAVVGCNRLRCRHCKADVRHQVRLAFRERADYPGKVLTALYETADLATSALLHDTGQPWRLYLCKCNRWLETATHACDAPDADATDPQMAWECSGHPHIALPHDFDGVAVATRAELRDLTVRFLHGFHPPGARAVDIPFSAWLCRLPARLAPDDAAVVVDAALEALGDPDPRARARALELFTVVPSDAARDTLIAMLGGDRDGFAGVPNDLTRWTTTKTLEETAWRVVAPLVEGGGRARELARADALAGRAGRVVFQALALGDSEWLALNAERIARVAPGRVEELVFGIAQLPLSMPIKALLSRARRAAEAGVDAPSMRTSAVSLTRRRHPTTKELTYQYFNTPRGTNGISTMFVCADRIEVDDSDCSSGIVEVFTVTFEAVYRRGAAGWADAALAWIRARFGEAVGAEVERLIADPNAFREEDDPAKPT